MKPLSVEDKVDILMQVSPLRHLFGNKATLWVSWDEKTVNIGGIKVGDISWVRATYPAPKRVFDLKKVLAAFFGYRHDEAVANEYCATDVLGQRWQGVGLRGHPVQFSQLKEI